MVLEEIQIHGVSPRPEIDYFRFEKSPVKNTGDFVIVIAPINQ